MTRTGKVVSWVVGIIVILLIAIVIFISLFDWNRLKPTINQKVSAVLIRGGQKVELTLTIGERPLR